MKRLVLLVLTVVLMFSGIPGYFCAAEDNGGIISDLTLLGQLESQRLMDSMKEYAGELEYRYNESIRVSRLMDGYYSTSGDKKQPINAYEVLYILGSSREINDNSLLFRDRIFWDYYRLRTTAVLEEYKKSGNIDIKSFVGRSKAEFDKFIGEVRKDSSKREKITLLLQDKLVGRMYSDETDNKSDYLDKVIAIRTAPNQDIRDRSIYELMESRVRLRLLEELISINKDALQTYLGKTKVRIRNDEKGVFSFSYISDIEKRTVLDYSVYLDGDNSGYKLMMLLEKLASIYGKAAFTNEKGDVRILSRDSIWSRIHMGAEGLEVNLNDSYISEEQLPGYDVFSVIPGSENIADTSKLLEKGKSLESGQAEAFRLAGEITESLSVLDSYSQLRTRGISNAYTAKFEAGKGAWLSSLNAKLNQMNRLSTGLKETDAGFIGFMNYIRQYVDYSRECAAAGLPESSQVLKFRDSVLQFRTVDEGALWILDMLYKLKYLN